MVKAGQPVDAVIDGLLPLLEPGDLVMDGGNSFFADTNRRSQALAARGYHFMGVGVSGGEEGALWGPSIMPGGSLRGLGAGRGHLAGDRSQGARRRQALRGLPGPAQRRPLRKNGPQRDRVRRHAAHRRGLRHPAPGARPAEAAELAAIFDEWNQGELDSYLIDITAQIFRRIDELTGRPLVDLVLDTAAAEGNRQVDEPGLFNIGAPVPTINSGCDAAHRLEHGARAGNGGPSVLPGPQARYDGDQQRSDRRRAPRALRQQDQRLRPGHGHAAHRQPRATVMT